MSFEPLRSLRVVALVACVSACASFASACGYPSVEGDVLGCGEAIWAVDHVAVKSNGAFQGTGQSCVGTESSSDDVVYGPKYQCVELASRYFMVHFGVDRPFDVDANGLCHKAEYGDLVQQVSVHRHATTSTDPVYVPVHGDLMVFASGEFGHVGIVETVDGNEIQIAEQNGAPSGRATHVLGSQECFIHARANHAAAALPLAPAP